MSRVMLFALFLSVSTGACASEKAAAMFIDYWNAGDERTQRDNEVFTEAFLERRGPGGLAQIMTMVYSDNGNIAVHSITSSSTERVEFLASSEKGNWMNIGLDIAADGRIAGFGVGLTNPPPREQDLGMSQEEIVARLGPYLDELAASGQFSGSVLLARNFEPLFARAYGMADREQGRPNTLDTPINLGSMNKMFTGLAITQLVASGQLAYDDTVGKHLPGYPNERVRNEATIHHLLTHTSGLGSYWNESYARSKNQLQDLEGFLATFIDQPLSFTPGEGNEYSNAGPVVLGLIIEKVTGVDYYDYIREHVYGPAAMKNSDHYDKFEVLSSKATGYFSPVPGGELISNFDDLGRIGSPAGGGYSSANDLLKFARALYDGSLIDKEHREIMTSMKVPWGGGGGYGYLFGDQRINGVRYIGHNGGAPGINAEFSHFPELGYTLIVLANLDHAASPVADQVRAWIAYSK